VIALVGGWLWLEAWPPESALARPLQAGSPVDCSPGNRVAYLGNLVVSAGDWICGDAIAYGGGVRVQGHVGGNVTAFAGSVTVSGEVDGNVTAFGGSVDLLPDARVSGDVQTWGGSVRRSPLSIVYGNVEREDRLTEMTGGRGLGLSSNWAFPWPWVLAWALLAAVVVTLFPERTARVGAVARGAALRSVVVGLLTALLGVGLASVLFATCIGIPVSLIVLGGLLAGWVLGTVSVGRWLGERLVGVVAARERRSALLPALVGMTLLAGAEAIPCVGGALALIVGSLGLGAALLSRFGTRRSGWPPPVPAHPLL
jgi:hypothetical protein